MDFDYDKLAAAIAKGNKGGGGNSAAGGFTGGGDSAGTGPLKKSFAELAGSMNPLGAAGEVATKAFGAAKNVVNDLEAAIKPNLNTWRDLSASGANFGNDVVAMSAAAAGTRMELGEFADLVKKNTTTFTGLGSNVANGAKAFASLSKDMQDSGVVDQLKAIGLTSKDANNALALTLGNQFTVNMNDAKSKQQAIESATKMATEMDLMSKLTGKTRAEQEELMKKAQMDAQFQAKLQLDTIGMSEKEAMEYRNKVTQAYNKAQMEGMGDVFKEVYAVGTVQTEAAANKMGLLPEQAGATEREIAALRKKNYAEAEKEQKNRELQISKDAQDKNKLELIILGDANTASKQLGESFINGQAIAKAYASKQKELMETEEFRNASKAQQDQMVKDAMDKDLKATQDGTSAGSQSTKALVQLESRAKDVESAFMNGIVDPINKKLAPSFEKLNNSVLSATGSTKGKDGKIQTKVQELEGGMKGGVEQPDQKTKTKGDFTTKAAENTKTGANESTISGVGRVAGGLVSEVAGGINAVMAPKKADGGIVPGTDKGTTVTVGEGGKPEAIVPLDQMKQDKPQGINVAEISKTISTTISSAQGPASMSSMSTSMSKMGMNDSQKKLFDEFSSLNAKQSEEKLASLKAEEDSAKSANKAAMLARDTIEEKAELENRKLTESEEAQFKALGKELNSSYDRIRVAEDAQKVLAKVEENKKTQTIFASESAAKIAEDLGLKQVDIAEKTSVEQQSILTDYQKTTLKYAYTDTEGKQMQLENAKKLVESEKNTIADKNKQLEEIQAAADGRELTNREKSRIERLQKEIEGSKETLSYREQDLEVYANLDKLKGETEIKSANDTAKEQIAAQEIAKNRLEAILKESNINELSSKEDMMQEAKLLTIGIQQGAEAETEARKESAMKALELVKSGPAAELSKIMKDNQEAAMKSMELAKAGPAAELSKIMKAAGGNSQDKLKTEMSKVSSSAGMPDFSTMFGGDKGKLPPFLENLNAKVKDMKPVAIPTPKEINKTSPQTASQTIKTEQQVQEEKARAKAAEVAATKSKTEDKPKAVAGVEQVGLKDLHVSLEHLNKSMAKLISYSEQTATAAQAQIKATKSLSNNNFN
jgi:hypothetical protein